MSNTTEAVKERSMILQKEMLAKQFKELSMAKELGKKVVYTFVPGNLTELILSFDMLPVYPEINALQSGMRKKIPCVHQGSGKNRILGRCLHLCKM